MANHEYPKNGKFSKYFKHINQLSINVKIPKIITDLFRTELEYQARLNNVSKLDTLDDFIDILKLRFIDIQNSLSAINKAIDRNNLKIEELEKTKNNKINFFAYSKDYTNTNPVQNQILKNSLDVNSNEVIGIIADEDAGIEFTEHLENGKSFIKIDIDDSKIDGLKFVTDSSVKINWNSKLNAYEVLQNDLFQYISENPESTITINHNLGTRALDIKVFKHDPKDLDMRYPIMTGIEYPSDNQVIIYLTNKQLISVLISRI